MVDGEVLAVTPRDRALCRFQHFRPNPHNNRFQVVICDNITTVHECSATTTEEIYTTRLKRVKNTTHTLQRSK